MYLFGRMDTFTTDFSSKFYGAGVKVCETSVKTGSKIYEMALSEIKRGRENR